MSKELRVGDGYRTNQLSLRPGGYSVVVEYTNGQKLVYDKIKNPSAYISRVCKNDDIVSAYIKE